MSISTFKKWASFGISAFVIVVAPATANSAEAHDPSRDTVWSGVEKVSNMIDYEQIWISDDGKRVEVIPVWRDQSRAGLVRLKARENRIRLRVDVPVVFHRAVAKSRISQELETSSGEMPTF